MRAPSDLPSTLACSCMSSHEHMFHDMSHTTQSHAILHTSLVCGHSLSTRKSLAEQAGDRYMRRFMIFFRYMFSDTLHSAFPSDSLLEGRLQAGLYTYTQKRAGPTPAPREAYSMPCVRHRIAMKWEHHAYLPAQTAVIPPRRRTARSAHTSGKGVPLACGLVVRHDLS